MGLGKTEGKANGGGFPAYRILGVKVHPATINFLLDVVGDSITDKKRVIIANLNLHSAYLARRDSKMRAFYKRAHVTHVDGMPLVWIGRLLGYSLRAKHRVTYVDFTGPLMERAARCNWSVFYLGSKPGVAEGGAETLRQRFPELRIQIHHGYFDATLGSEENERLLEEITAISPQVLMVGMSQPRQEHWILDNLERITANAILTSGAAIDYVAEAIETPPRWMGRFGLEWAFRLFDEPGRLWRRYLIEPWSLLGPLARDLWVMRLHGKKTHWPEEQ